MTTIDLKGINKVRKRLADGTIKVYHYHRATGTLLPGLPGSADFLEAYKSADRIAPRDTGLVAGLIREYLASPQFAENGSTLRLRSRKRGLKPLAESTKRDYRRMLKALEGEFGTMPIAALAAPRVIGKFIDYQEEIGMDHPREADYRLMVLSAVFSYALRKGHIARNPLFGFARMYDGDRSDLIWTEREIRLFINDAPIELQRALILAIHSGQRYGDLIRLRWSDYDGVYIRLKQNKTGAKVTVKVTAALKRMLDTTPKAGPYILVRADGRPWFTKNNDKEMGKAWRKHMDATGLRRADYLVDATSDRDLLGVSLHFNDIRGTAVTLLAEAGCTIPEIVSITGHTLESATRILEKYLSRTKVISDAAMFKFENAKATEFANRLQTSEAS